jgi:alkylhydroperoxidase/carboxymuconolactone decarboxylase family protein YurZ
LPVSDPSGRITRDALRFAEIAALAAVGAPAISWLTHLDQDEAGFDADEIAAVLATIAPIIGDPQVVAAAETALAAARFVEDTGPI